MTTWVILAGLPGTGKSTLARALVARLRLEHVGGVILDKDRVREALFPGEFTDYTREQDDLCVRAMLAAAAYLTRTARAQLIFLDGRTYSRREQLDEAVSAAEEAGAHWKVVHVVCADDAAEARLGGRDADNPATNRNAGLYRQIKGRFEEIVRPHITIDTTDGTETQVAQILELLGL